jgi:hypothetical protein
MVQDRAVLTTWGRHLGASPICLFLLVLALVSPRSLHGQDALRNDLNISIGAHWTRHVLAGGWGATVGLRWRELELLAGGELYSERSGVMVAGRYYLRSTPRVMPFVGLRAAYYYDLARLFGRPSYSLNYHVSAGIKLRLSGRLWAQGQLGVGYTGFFREGGSQVFAEKWIPMRMLHWGIAYDIPIKKPASDEPPTAPPVDGKPELGRLSVMFHAGLPISLFAPPSFERFTGGLGCNLHPKLTLTVRHQAIRTSLGLKYGKTMAGVRWMPGGGRHVRWIGSLEIGHFGSLFSSGPRAYAVGVTAGQHLNIPVTQWLALDCGLQYGIFKVPSPLNPAGSDFETSLGLVIRPGAWRKRI